ncbi:CIA30 family protein [Pelagicoccus albus]|uniref:CIA30 family protein n=1 Tax=Pelagicoccus albus TaxID=415222 RepID=A0A7X1E9D8_9BACT|nr:CIA30 family protein [Pelagicoccus albus]MBC2607309.1 CIA30 family protein [Pelagicoccus albus]
MKTPTLLNSLRAFATATALLASFSLSASEIPASIDQLEDSNKNELGHQRLFMDDTSVGGQTTFAHSVEEGVLIAKGKISPPRGQPGWASAVFLLTSDGTAADLSEYEGIRLLIRINKGTLSVSANSTEVTNFDYHAAPLARAHDKAFHEVKIPFSSMKRAWSQQTELNTKTIASLSLVAFGLQAGDFEYELDEIGFY